MSFSFHGNPNRKDVKWQKWRTNKHALHNVLVWLAEWWEFYTLVCPCGNSALPPSSFKDGFLSLIRPPSSSLFCFKISSKKEVGEKSAQGKDGKAVSLLNLLFSHRPNCRGNASLSQPRSRVLKRRNDQSKSNQYFFVVTFWLRFEITGSTSLDEYKLKIWSLYLMMRSRKCIYSHIFKKASSTASREIVCTCYLY